MEYSYKWVEDNKKNILLVSFSSLIIYHIILIAMGQPLTESLVFLAFGALMFFIGWGMIFFVLGLQAFNPFCPKSLFKWFCYIFLGFTTLSLILSVVSDVITPFTGSTEDTSMFALSPLSAGMLLSAFRLYEKNVIHPEGALYRNDLY